MILPRRKFLIGLGSLIAAPAIVRAETLMSVKSIKQYTFEDYVEQILNPMMQEYEEKLKRQMAIDVLYGSLKVGDKITFGGLFQELEIVSIYPKDIYNV